MSQYLKTTFLGACVFWAGVQLFSGGWQAAVAAFALYGVLVLWLVERTDGRE